MTVKSQTPTLDTLLRCSTCDRDRYVNFATCLSEGWPKCPVEGHGTMRLERTDADVERAVKQAVAGARQVIRRAMEVRTP